MTPCQIFISYRRDNGGDKFAYQIYRDLQSEGYEVFFDTDSMEDGKFNTQIYRQIEVCESLLLVLPPKALDRCSNPEDWLRLEIVHAIEHNKRIVPLMMKGFIWPDSLPEAIRDIPFLQAVQEPNVMNSEYYNAMLRIVRRYLLVSPRNTVQPRTSPVPPLLDIDAQLVQMRYLLEDSKFSEAERLADEILTVDPKCAKAYMGKLLSQIKLTSEVKLQMEKEPYDTNPNWQRALEWADDSLKIQYLGYLLEYLESRIYFFADGRTKNRTTRERLRDQYFEIKNEWEELNRKQEERQENERQEKEKQEEMREYQQLMPVFLNMDIERQLLQLRNFLDCDKFFVAEQLADMILATDPKCAQAYMGKLLSQHRIKSEEQLYIYEYDLESNPNWRKALEWADDQLKIHYLDCLLHWINFHMNLYDALTRQSLETRYLEVQNQKKSLEKKVRQIEKARITALESQYRVLCMEFLGLRQSDSKRKMEITHQLLGLEKENLLPRHILITLEYEPQIMYDTIAEKSEMITHKRDGKRYNKVFMKLYDDLREYRKKAREK